MTTSEPTTEIVDDLRIYLLVANKEKPTQLISTIARAADRLESQENEIEELKAEAIVNALENAERIANLTARAEQAEAREREAVKDMETLMKHSNAGCVFCKKKDTGCKDGCIKPKWRGQPQDGEGL